MLRKEKVTPGNEAKEMHVIMELTLVNVKLLTVE